MYYYVYNLQGDVTHIINSSGTVVGTYQYDAWGRILNLSSLTAIAQANPFRYRGYYYDTETGLYYLNSRYYNAEWGRFINADGELAGVGGSLQGYNLFAYCMNNPVNLSDEAGNWPKWLSGAINTVSGTLQMVTGAALGATVGWTGIGAVAAGFLMVNGAATAAQGIGQIVNHVTNTNTFREDNIVRTSVQSVGAAVGGNTGAMVAGVAYDAAVLATNAYACSFGGGTKSPTTSQATSLHTSGVGSPNKNINPGGSYTKLDNKGNLYSYTQFDNLGRQTMRIDFQGRPHAGVLPHIHMYTYPQLGGRAEYIFDLNWHLID